eukprot:symbB.v1.2.015637.t1/scaffold1142.1/size245703/6
MGDWSDADMQRALRESMESNSMRVGTPLSSQVLRDMGIFFECQAPGSDTCGLNALNNLCQAHMFSVEDLKQAEAQHAQVTQGGNFAQRPSLTEVPSGFFDVEALKIAAATKDVEIIEVEPIPDFQKSRCFAFAEASQSFPDGSFLLGFLVYDRQPGQMHYYALCRQHRMPGMWVKLDSQLPSAGEPKNTLLQEAELWEIYTAAKPMFQSWLIRWYPVVWRKGAVRQVCRMLESRNHSLTSTRCTSVLQENGWLVSSAVQQLLEVLPRLTVRQLLVKFARPSEAEMQSLLEASGWDLSRAQPAIDRVLKQRINLAKQVDTGESTLEALSLCNWDPRDAAALLALRLHLGATAPLSELQQALELSSGDADRAEAVVQLKNDLGSMEHAAKLLQQTQTWSVQSAKKVLELRRRFPRTSVAVALEVLRRNDEDPHAACEMLEEFRQRIRRNVTEEWDQYLLQGEESFVAESALDMCDWDPRRAFVFARNLASAVKTTRRLASQAVNHPSFSNQRFSIDSVITALTYAKMNPKAAVAVPVTSRSAISAVSKLKSVPFAFLAYYSTQTESLLSFVDMLALKRVFLGTQRHLASVCAQPVARYEGVRASLAITAEVPKQWPSVPLKLLTPLTEGKLLPDGYAEIPEALECANRSPMARIPKPANRGSRSRGLIMRKLRKRSRTGN